MLWFHVLAGLVVIAVGVSQLVTGGTTAGSLLTPIGVLLTVSEFLRPSRRLEDRLAKERLEQIRREDRRKRRGEEERRRRNQLGAEGQRQAKLRDLAEIREAILKELGKLRPPEPLVFAWGGRSNTEERRAYWLENGKLVIEYSHSGQSGAWLWEERGLPRPIGTPEPDPHRVEDVERAYGLIQPERYLAIARGKTLEEPEPGYFRFGS